MAAFRFSRRAEADLVGIATYTLRTWGKAQTARYLGDLEAFCRALADNPALGRSCDEVRPGLRRMEHGKHVVFYRQDGTGILISRIPTRACCPKSTTPAINPRDRGICSFRGRKSKARPFQRLEEPATPKT